MERQGEMQQSKFGRICVFCGSSQGKKTSYQDAAIQLGQELVYAHIYQINIFLFKIFYTFFGACSFYYMMDFDGCNLFLESYHCYLCDQKLQVGSWAFLLFGASCLYVCLVSKVIIFICMD